MRPGNSAPTPARSSWACAKPRRCCGERVARHGNAWRRPGQRTFGDRNGEIARELASAPRLLRQLRDPLGDEGRWLEARLPELQGRAFSAHRPRRDHAGEFGRQGPDGPAETFPAWN